MLPVASDVSGSSSSVPERFNHIVGIPVAPADDAVGSDAGGDVNTDVAAGG